MDMLNMRIRERFDDSRELKAISLGHSYLYPISLETGLEITITSDTVKAELVNTSDRLQATGFNPAQVCEELAIHDYVSSIDDISYTNTWDRPDRLGELYQVDLHDQGHFVIGLAWGSPIVTYHETKDNHQSLMQVIISKL